MTWINLNRLKATDSPHVLRTMTAPAIERAISMRKYAWNKPSQQIADEAGVNIETINRVLRREPVSNESYAKLTGYLRTPIGKAALINNRAGRASPTSSRRPFMRRVMRLTAMAIRYNLKCASKVTCMGMTAGELRAYYYRLDFRVKEAIMIDPRWPDHVKGKYIIPDCLEAWQWVERLDLLRQLPMQSLRSPSAPGQQIGNRHRSTDHRGPFPSP